MSSNDGTAIIFNGAGMPLEETKFPLTKNLGKREILVRISLSTICGSDLHTWQGHRPFPIPCILGHEMVGKIVELGNDVKNDYNGDKLVNDDRIVWSMTVSCNNCFFCNNNIPQKCTQLFKYGHEKSNEEPYFTGGFAKYIILKENSVVFKIPNELSDEEVAPLMCAGACVLGGFNIANFSDCDFLIVQGCGALGMYACAFGKELGAKTIIAMDPIQSRLDMAKQFGADYVINSNKSSEKIFQEINNITNSRGADYVVEVTGDPSVIDLGIKFLRIGGKYILLGAIYPGNKVTINSSEIITKCIQLFGLHNYSHENLKYSIELIRKNKSKYPFKKLVAPKFDLTKEGVENAFKSLKSKESFRPAIIPK
jgi:alcohol dehydrogenase